jgi:formylglycine-generating enzyme
MKVQSLLNLAATSALITSASASVTIEWVTVGDPGNAADTTGYGAVANAYQIGKYEVTNAQYGAFLNAKGASNSYGIYNSNMASYGITQSGSIGSFTYNVNGMLANRPVVYVSWYDAARFANWLVNGQGNGSMETGAYTLNGNTGTIPRNAGANIFLPSGNEWYKAAYYQGNGTYSLFPNGQNSVTSQDANYWGTASTDVGTYAGDPSFYGSYDQGGNAYEWTDQIAGSALTVRGGSWGTFGDLMKSNMLQFIPPTVDSFDFGFRVASVPEPTSIVLTLLASGVMLIRRKR